jgi:hypothetical protein
LSDPNAGLPPRYGVRPRPRDSSVSRAGRWKHRTYGTGPAYRKIGGRVVYALDDLKARADRDAKTSTSDPGNGRVLPAKRQAAPIPYAGKSRR